MLRALTPSRCLFILATVSVLLLFTLVPRYELLESESTQLVARQVEVGGGSSAEPGASASPSQSHSADPSSASSQPVTSQQPSTTSQQSQTSQQQQQSSASQSSASSNTPPSASSVPPSTTSEAPPQTSNNNQPGPAQSSPTTAPPTPTPTVSQVTSVNSDGETVVISVTVTPSITTSPSASSSAGSGSGNNDGGSGTSTATIVGLSVAGGVALIGIAAFVVWKFTRKRFSDSDFDDNEAIKWPELNTHGESPHALPTNKTANFGMETNSEVNLTRPDSRAGSFAPSASASAVDLYAAQDPYAVPPLPHLNPNQPYRDDPHGGAFYDPYSGPVPQTFADADTASMQGGPEAIPMTQINRSRSPGPAMAYDMAGRASPGPQQAYFEQGRASPGPRAMSPGPQVALGGRASPGPQVAYGAYGGRQSPGPQMAYGGPQ